MVTKGYRHSRTWPIKITMHVRAQMISVTTPWRFSSCNVHYDFRYLIHCILISEQVHLSYEIYTEYYHCRVDHIQRRVYGGRGTQLAHGALHVRRVSTIPRWPTVRRPRTGNARRGGVSRPTTHGVLLRLLRAMLRRQVRHVRTADQSWRGSHGSRRTSLARDWCVFLVLRVSQVVCVTLVYTALIRELRRKIILLSVGLDHHRDDQERAKLNQY